MRRRYDFNLKKSDNIRFFLVAVPIAVTRRVFSGNTIILYYIIDGIILIKPVFIIIGHRIFLNWLIKL
jgi:hypothetical protein